MAATSQITPLSDLLSHSTVQYNLTAPALAEEAIRRGEARFSADGAVVARTNLTGRSPKDKFMVRDATTESKVAWGGFNNGFDPDKFDALYERVLDYLRGRDLFVQDLFCGADERHRLEVRFINQYAWHNLFVRELFIRPTAEELPLHKQEFTVVSAPGFKAVPERDGTRSENFVIVNITRRLAIIGGTQYAGEMKKTIFGLMNYALPQRDVFPMHCSANIGHDGVSALFFGLSGTGKTTLSADPARNLIGDDEHGWSPQGVFNFEGGCYAKCIKLSKEKEPQIWNAIRFGTVLENVEIDERTRKPNYDSEKFTENTRAAYPVDFIENAVIPGVGGHPKNVVFLTADAFGVLPPISRLTPEQAMFHFLSGYTAKVAGTEAGVKEPTATFSTCFGAPFMPLPPKTYAEMLGKRLREHHAQCWLVNTGWQGGPYGVGKRMDLPYTRAMVDAAVEGLLDDVEYEIEPTFGFSIPKSCPGVPAEKLNPRNSWADKASYDKMAADLIAQFRKNIENFDVPDAVRNAAPGPVGK